MLTNAVDFSFKDSRFQVSPTAGRIFTWYGSTRFGTEIMADQAGTYRLTLRAGRYGGKVPEGYAFRFSVYVDGSNTDQFVTVPAGASSEMKTGTIDLTLTAPGRHLVTFQWVNDLYIPAEGYDANLEVATLDVAPVALLGESTPDTEPAPVTAGTGKINLVAAAAAAAVVWMVFRD